MGGEEEKKGKSKRREGETKLQWVPPASPQLCWLPHLIVMTCMCMYNNRDKQHQLSR